MPSPSTTPPALFGLDWGTTSCRIWALDESGRVIDGHRAPLGILTARTLDQDVDRAFTLALDRMAGDALAAHPDTPVLCCGMVGSNRGWAEAPYLALPAPLRIPAGSLTTVRYRDRDVRIVPGLRQPPTERRPFADVIRGEETQLIGAVAAVGSDHSDDELFVVLPGTHTKWVRVVRGEIVAFSTAMTGDLYQALIGSTILASSAEAPETLHREAFQRGIRTRNAFADELGLLGLPFSARTLGMDGTLDAAEAGDYLSGMLIADEVAHLAPKSGRPLVICGDGPLSERYRLALEALGHQVQLVAEDACARGLWAIARGAELVDTGTEKAA